MTRIAVADIDPTVKFSVSDIAHKNRIETACIVEIIKGELLIKLVTRSKEIKQVLTTKRPLSLFITTSEKPSIKLGVVQAIVLDDLLRLIPPHKISSPFVVIKEISIFILDYTS